MSEGAGKTGLRFEARDAAATLGIGWLTAVLGIVSGYALFILWWQQQEEGTTGGKFLLAFGAAAGMSFAFEALRGVIEGHELPWSRSRVISTIVMLAAFELFIIAVHGAAEMDRAAFVGVAGFIFGEQFADNVGPGWNLAALGVLWVVVALTIVSKLRKYIQGWPYPDSHERPGETLRQYLKDMAPDLARGAWAGALAGALWGAVAAVAYVFLFRAYFLAQWIHLNFGAWGESLAAGGPFHLQGYPAFFLYGPMLFAGWCAKLLGGIGLFIGIVVATLFAQAVVSDDNRALAMLWPAATMLLLLGSPILADKAARHDLVALAYLSAMIWGVPALLLGMMTPLLRGAAHHPPVWGVVATAAAAVILVVTVARFHAGESSALERIFFGVAAAGLLALAFQLFRGTWSEEFWLLVALAMGTVVWGGTRLMQSVNLFDMQKSAHALIAVPLGTLPQPLTAQQELTFAPFLNFPRTGNIFTDGGMSALLPGGVNDAEFIVNPCGAVRSFTPDQRATFASGMQQAAALDMKAAATALNTTSDSARRFQLFQQRWQTAIEGADAPAEGKTAGEQISGVRARLTEMRRLDDTRQRWQTWSTSDNPDASGALGRGEPASVCDPDLDNILADLTQSDQNRRTTESNLAQLKRQIGSQLPEEGQMAAAEGKVEGLRDQLQLGQAQQLELAMTSSLGFWLTVGLLAMWRLARPDPGEATHHS